ncbi:MAG: transporter [Verrucomicrobia bacterium]|nr:transporter [Verrucomicrobiota bacterium]
MKKLLTALVFATAPLVAQVTETPTTIEPGKFFLRMDAVTVGVNRDTTEPNRYTALGLASSILSIGMTENTDVQVGAQFFVRSTYQFRGTRSSRSGWGDTSLRTKWRFWRDDKAGASAAVIPFVKIPSKASGIGNNHMEGGVIVPWLKTLGPGSEVGAMAEWDVVRNDNNDGYDSRWFASAYVRQHIVGGFGAYAESTLAVSSASSSSFAGSLGVGVTFDFTKRAQLDYGLSRGLGGRATDWVNVLRLRWSF